MKVTPTTILSAYLPAIFAAFLISCSEQTPLADYRVIPLPAAIIADDVRGYTLNDRTQILYPAETNTAAQTARFLASYIQKATGLIVPVGEMREDKDADCGIRLELSDTIHAAESYRIRIDGKGIKLLAGNEEGLFRAVQTLRKSFPASSESAVAIQFPAGEIIDAPRFGYRGVMLDVSRNFYPVEFIKKTIDMLALHNLNRLHLHLTDDQGWRIEIKKYPLLAEVSSQRPDAEGRIYGSYYTQQEIRELVAYAQERFITIIPEIDMPGHVEAALTAYPELGCTGGPYTITSQPGVRQDILCVGNARTLQFAKDILAEVMELFPSEYIHIGGDEVPVYRWEVCSKCQQMIRKQQLKDVENHSAEQLLQGWFNTEIEEFLFEHGRKLIGWDEILDGGVSPRSTIMAWRGVNKGFEAVRKGHDVIMSPHNKFYFDYYQSVNTDSEPQAFGSCINAETVYRAEVASRELTSAEQAHILGVQGNLWTPHIATSDHAEYMLLPRVTALAEMAWCEPDQLDFSDFLRRMPRMQNFYGYASWNFAPHLFDITAEFTPDTVRGQLLVTLSAGTDAEIRYTLDGSRPDAASKHYTKPLAIDSDASLRAVAFTPDGQASDLYRKEIDFNKTTLKPVELLTQPAPRYAENRLTDGVGATTIYARGGWTGYQNDNMIAVVDLGEFMSISSAGISTLIDYSSHIMDAAAMEIAVSNDNRTFRTVAREDYAPRVFSQNKEMAKHILDFEPVSARYVRYTVNKASQLPPQMATAQGMLPFLFVDEIFIY